MEALVDLPYGDSPATLRKNFVDSLEERLACTAFYWDAVLKKGGGERQIANFVGAIHYLAGAAGVHGFVSTSRLSYQIIDQFAFDVEAEEWLEEDVMAQTQTLLDQLFEQAKTYQDQGVVEAEDHWIYDQATRSSLRESSDVLLFAADTHDELGLKVLLDAAGFRTHTFQSLHKLNKIYETHSPSAIIIDLQQSWNDPTADEFFDSLESEQPRCPVLALSAVNDFETRLAATRLGATHFFMKPANPSRIVEALHRSMRMADAQSRVLIVDDDPETAVFVSARLQLEGLDTHIVHDPFLVFDEIDRFSPDLIVTDLYMPGCNGLELASMIRQHEVYFDVPIVFLTSDIDEETRLAALQLGSDDFFSKSVDVDLVAKAISSRLVDMKSYTTVKNAMTWSLR